LRPHPNLCHGLRPARAELREETGFVGTVKSTSPPLALSPGLTDESVRLCVVEVNLNAPENQVYIYFMNLYAYISI